MEEEPKELKSNEAAIINIIPTKPMCVEVFT